MPDDRSSYEFRIVKNPRRNTKQALLASSEKVVEKDCSGGTFYNDDALSKFLGCTKITGDLIFSGFQPDFRIFKALREITGDFRIENNAVITKISGFENLRFIRGNFNIYNNPLLTSISGFANLRIIGKNFYIRYHNLLKTISGFGNLRIIGENFYIRYHTLLTSISGFANLRILGEEFDISSNEELTTIPGFGNLLSVAGNFSIYTNALLKTISGFANLLSVGNSATLPENGYFFITTNGGMAKPNKNKVVTTVTGFGKLTPLTGIKGNLTLKGVSDVLLLGIAASIRTNLSGATDKGNDIAYVYPALASQAYTKPASITRRLVPNNLLNSVTYKTVHNTKYIKMNYI